MNNKERDMFYSNYGYTGTMPYQMPYQTGPMMPNQMNPNMYNQNDLESRVSKLEKQVKRLEARVSRLENPYGTNNTNIYNEPDSNMYMI